MKTIRPGFSLIEFLVYFFLIVQLTVLVTSYMISSYATITGYNKISDIDINLSCAVDILERDIKQCFSPHGTFHKVGNEYIWVAGLSVSWEVKGGNLMRSEGQYDADTSQWYDVVRGVIVNNIKAIHIEPCYEGDVIRSVRCLVESNNSNNIVMRVVAIRNKKL